MNKKVFAIILIVCLAFGVAFAAKASGLKAGVQLGYGGFSFTIADKDDTKNYLNIADGGFYGAVDGKYEFAKDLSVKAEFGVIIMGKSSWTINYIGQKKTFQSDAFPVHFSVYAGAEYCIEIAKDLCVDLGVGFDVLMGKMTDDDSDAESFNAAMGPALEAEVEYHFSDNFKASLGGKFAWHPINTNKDITEFLTWLADEDIVTNFGYQVYAGCTYAF